MKGKSAIIDISDHPDIGKTRSQKLGVLLGGEGFKEYREIYVQQLALCRSNKDAEYEERVKLGSKSIISKMKENKLNPVSYDGDEYDWIEADIIISQNLRKDISPMKQVEGYKANKSAKGKSYVEELVHQQSLKEFNIWMSR